MPAQRSRRLALLVAGLAGLGLVAAPPALASQAPSATPTCSVTQDLLSADAYWVANGTDMAPDNWENSAFHVGNLAMVRTIGSTNHITLPWAEANNYQLPADPTDQPFVPEDEAVGEAYLALYYYHPTPANLAPLRDRVAAEDASVAQGNDTYWNTVDALNLAMPSFAQLGVMDASQADLDTMHTLFDYARSGVAGRGLYDQQLGLWWQSAKDIGTGTFWSRGNGEAFAGLAKVLAQLPATDPHRAEYLKVYQRMALTLLVLQRSDGFWNVDLANPFDHAGPETSGTALITYGLAWGINNGLLPARLYQPAVTRAWHGLTTKALQPSGLVGYVQGPATGPSGAQPITAADTSAYGVGEFLLAGQQMAILTPGCTQPAS